MSPDSGAATISLPSSFRLEFHQRIDSTNEEAKRRAQQGAPEGTLIAAAEQFAGKGRAGRVFQSPPGNVYASLLLRPRMPPFAAAQTSFVTALAVAQAIRAHLPAAHVALKWPNDVLLEGGKVSGILLESAMNPDGDLRWLIIGTGINVRSHPEGLDPPANSLHTAGAVSATADAVLSAYCEALDQWLSRWRAEGFAPVRRAWLESAKGRGEKIAVRLLKATLHGVFEDIDRNGALLLRSEDGACHEVSAGEVYFPTG